MAQFAVYGKRTQPIKAFDGDICGPDKQFAPLDEKGIRTTKKELTNTFATREDAQEWIDNHKFKQGVEVEVRNV